MQEKYFSKSLSGIFSKLFCSLILTILCQVDRDRGRRCIRSFLGHIQWQVDNFECALRQILEVSRGLDLLGATTTGTGIEVKFGAPGRRKLDGNSGENPKHLLVWMYGQFQ